MSYGSNRQSGDRSRNLAFMGSLINHDDLIVAMSKMNNDINANAYRSKVIDRRRGNRSRESEVVMGSLIDDGD